MTIYIWNGKKWRRLAFSTEARALAYIKRHNIDEYDDEFGYRHIKIGG